MARGCVMQVRNYAVADGYVWGSRAAIFGGQSTAANSAHPVEELRPPPAARWVAIAPHSEVRGVEVRVGGEWLPLVEGCPVPLGGDLQARSLAGYGSDADLALWFFDCDAELRVAQCVPLRAEASVEVALSGSTEGASERSRTVTPSPSRPPGLVAYSVVATADDAAVMTATIVGVEPAPDGSAVVANGATRESLAVITLTSSDTTVAYGNLARFSRYELVVNCDASNVDIFARLVIG